MNELIRAVLDVVPPGAHATSLLVELVEIVPTDTVPTAAIRGRPEPRMLLNPGFVATHAATPERLLMLVMHELHHHLLGHTRRFPVITPLDNLGFDAVINALLCRAFPDPRGIALLTSFYDPGRVPEALLRPPDGWRPDGPAPLSPQLMAAGRTRLAEIHQELYSWPGASYAELREAIADVVPDAALRAVPLLGSHGIEHAGDGREDHDPVLADVLRGMTSAWPRTRLPLIPDDGEPSIVERSVPSVRVVGSRARLRSRLRWAGRRASDGPGAALDVSERSAVGPLRSGSRRDVVAGLLGSPILLHEHAVTDRERIPVTQRVHVYLDVSGSVYALLPALMASIRDCAAFVHPVVHAFSTAVVDHSFADLRLGRIRSTGGTDIACVVAHAREHRIRRAVIVSDGVVGRPSRADAATLAAMRGGLACTEDPVPPDLGRHVGRAVTLADAIRAASAA
ncbi:MAG: hypothetical protein ACKOTZ_10960 [Chloroflexota bacterium]